MSSLTRRHILKTTATALFAAHLPLSLGYASTPQNRKLVVVLLRGGMDGLAALIPHRDAHYVPARGDVAMPISDQALIALNDTFAMPKALEPLARLFHQQELLFMHAASTPYRDRSHFDAQNMLETGCRLPHARHQGWLNMTVQQLSRNRNALAMGSAVPLLLQGDARVGSWSPATMAEPDDHFMDRVQQMYASDPLLKDALQTAQAMQNLGPKSREKSKPRDFTFMMRKLGSFMQAPGGATIAGIELGGWDTHVNQGTEKGRLPRQFTRLAEGIEAFKEAMGEQWQHTAMLVLTEFGRTAKANGTGGTDHGTASAAFLLGGAVKGGCMAGDWPGMASLYEDRDLMPANDLRGLIKTVLHQHLEIAEPALDDIIFPNSRSVWLRQSLFRSSYSF